MEERTLDFKYLSNYDLVKGGYITIPKELYLEELYKDLSNDAVLLYGILLDRFKLSKNNSFVDKYGRTYVLASLEKISEILNVSRGKARSTLRELQEVNLLRIERMKGYNSKRRIFLGEFIGGDDKEDNTNRGWDKKDTMEGTKFESSKVQNLYPNKPYINKPFNNKYINKDTKINTCYLDEFDFED